MRQRDVVGFCRWHKKKRLGFSPLGSRCADSLTRDVDTKGYVCSRELNGRKSH